MSLQRKCLPICVICAIVIGTDLSLRIGKRLQKQKENADQCVSDILKFLKIPGPVRADFPE